MGYLDLDAHFRSGRDGAEFGIFRNLGAIAAADHGFLLTHNGQGEDVDSADLAGGVFYFDKRTKNLSGPITPYLSTQGDAGLASLPEPDDGPTQRR
jgi:hypothetical protein